MTHASCRHCVQARGPAPATVTAVHDPIYRRLFAFPRMVADLLEVVGHRDWIGDIDLGTLEKLPAEHVGDSAQQRRGDAVWRVRFRNGWLYLLVLLEFQSGNDPRMALRNLEYTALLYRELDRRGQLGPPGRWPPVLPVVLYNGDAPWTGRLDMRELVAPVPDPLAPCQPAQRSLLLDERRVAVDDLPLGNLMRAVIGFEQSRTPADIVRVARAMRGWLRSPRDSELERAFVAWMRQMVALGSEETELELGGTVEEVTVTLVERMAQWPAQWREEGRREGMSEGRSEGVAAQRALLGRQAAGRFGDAVGRQVEAVLADVEDWNRLALVGEWIVRADSGPELLDGVSRMVGRSG